MTTNSKTPNPAITEAGAVELSETELDRASGGFSFGASGAENRIKAAVQKVADGIVKPGESKSAGGPCI